MANEVINSIITGFCVAVCAVVVIGKVFLGLPVSDTVMGIALGTIANIAGNAIAQSFKQYVFRVPRKAKVDIKADIQENK